MRTLNPSISATLSPLDPSAGSRVITVPAIDEDVWVEDTFYVENKPPERCSFASLTGKSTEWA